MIIVTHISQLRAQLRAAQLDRKSIGFVPTMGALHSGHLSLIEIARQHSDFVVASVFVNPQQFGPGEDFDQYPRQAEKDAAMLEAGGTDLLFLPEPKEIYPVQPRFKLTPGDTANLLCGKTRPGHFAGVGIVVAKLLNLVNPDFLFLGQKDLQQTVIIRQLIEDLNFPVQLIVCPIVRESDGLAMSSRNRYLNEGDRNAASGIFRTLRKMAEEAKKGKNAADLIILGKELLENIPGLKLDYLEIVQANSLASVSEINPDQNPVIAAAAYFGKTRLIDNEFIFS